MKRRVIFVVAVLLILVGIFALAKAAADFLTPKGKGALQVTTNVETSVFLDNKAVGDAPLCMGCEDQRTINVGDHDLRIVPKDQSLQPFTAKIRINKGVLTAVERTFLPGALSSSYTLSLEETDSKEAQLFIASLPDGALITIDGESKGVTPLQIDSISESEHEVVVQKQGFAKKTVNVRTVPSYKLVLNVILGTDAGPDETTDTNISPTEGISPTATPIPENSVVISNTPTGFLRVREDSTTTSSEIGRVNPGEVYQYTDETNDWFKILLKDGAEGWISKDYAELASTTNQ